MGFGLKNKQNISYTPTAEMSMI